MCSESLKTTVVVLSVPLKMRDDSKTVSLPIYTMNDHRQPELTRTVLMFHFIWGNFSETYCLNNRQPFHKVHNSPTEMSHWGTRRFLQFLNQTIYNDVEIFRYFQMCPGKWQNNGCDYQLMTWEMHSQTGLLYNPHQHEGCQNNKYFFYCHRLPLFLTCDYLENTVPREYQSLCA
jgi:hypothetical protein